MKNLNLKTVALALSLTVFSSLAANATNIVHTADANPSVNAEAYSFSTNLANGTFSDYVAFTFAGTRDLVASISGSANLPNIINFTTFNLLGADQSTVIQTGNVFNILPQLTFAGLSSDALSGNYFLHIAGNSIGTSQYAGTISLAAPVPEAETYSMMLLGLGLMGFIALRRRTD